MLFYHDTQADSTASRTPSGWAALLRLAAIAGITVLAMFLAWQVVEQSFADDAMTLGWIYAARGISTSLVTAAVVGWRAYRDHRDRARALTDEIDCRVRESDRIRRLLELVVDTTPASLMVLDDSYRVVQANRTAERVHGHLLLGTRCQDSLDCGDDQCERCPATISLRRQVPSRGARLYRDAETGEILEVESHPLRLADENYVLLVETVVTERKKLEASLLHQEKMAAFGLFAAQVAHDLGNPLSSIDAQLQLVDERSLPADAAEAIQLVRHEVRRLHRILRELVDFARRRRDEVALVSMTAVVGDALRLLRHDQRMRDVRVDRDFHADVPPVSIVEDHLTQVVLNLLMNALDAMPEGGTLKVQVQPSPAGAVLRVKDDGEGMRPEVLRRCTEPLFTTKAEGKGTGLGLSIARDIIESAGGQIELHSSPGRGTTAIVLLPTAAAEVSVPERLETAQAMSAP